MSRKEFYEKHTKTENGMYPGQQDVACSVTTPPIQLWQWIEQREERIIKIANNIHNALMDSAIKQARVDENERWKRLAYIVHTKNADGFYEGDFDNRIKELTGEL